jgi:hypothetical protein
MSENLMGYTRNTRAVADMRPSEFAVITIGENQFSLAQSISGTLNQQVRPTFVLGESGVYWNIGYTEGQADIARLAGGGNFFDAFQARDCGLIAGMSVVVDGAKPCLRRNPNLTSGGRGSLRFVDGVYASLAFRMQAGQSEITEAASMRFATISN